MRDRARALGDVVDGRHMLVHAIGALAGPDDARAERGVAEETPARRIGALAGPALPADLVAGRFAAMVCASPFDEVTREARRLLNLPPAIRLYTSRDLPGVELAAALSGAYTVAFGMADALGMGPGPRAVLVTRVVAEAQRLVEALGGEPRTFTGLAGLGNLLVRTSPGPGDTRARLPVRPRAGAERGRRRAARRPARARGGARGLRRRPPGPPHRPAHAGPGSDRPRHRRKLAPTQAAAALSDTVALAE